MRKREEDTFKQQTVTAVDLYKNNEQNKMKKKTYPEKDRREKCKWQYAEDQRTFNTTRKPYPRLS